MKILDISKPLYKEMPVYPGQPHFVLTQVSNIPKDAYNETSHAMHNHTGTHVDAPKHVLENGVSIDALALEHLIGECQILNLQHVGEVITQSDLEEKTITKNIVLLQTKNSFGPENAFNPNFVALEDSAAQYLVNQGIKAIGIDAPSIKKLHVKNQVHHIFLNAGVPIIEGLNLKKVEEKTYQFICLPLNIKGADGAPCRAILIEK